jgi:hypothetical protein
MEDVDTYLCGNIDSVIGVYVQRKDDRERKEGRREGIKGLQVRGKGDYCI